MTQRITTVYTAGLHKYMFGYSDILNQDKVSKADPVTRVSGVLEHVRIQIDKVLVLNQIRHHRAISFLEWLRRNIFSLGAFCYMKGNTDHFIMGEDVLEYVEKEVDFMQSAIRAEAKRRGIPENTDFLYQTIAYLAEIDSLRAFIRDLEGAYVGWLYDLRVQADLIASFKHDMQKELPRDEWKSVNRLQNMITLGDILDRLSTYTFWLMRYEVLLMHQEGIEVEEKEWDSQMRICGNVVSEFPKELSEWH